MPRRIFSLLLVASASVLPVVIQHATASASLVCTNKKEPVTKIVTVVEKVIVHGKVTAKRVTKRENVLVKKVQRVKVGSKTVQKVVSVVETKIVRSCVASTPAITLMTSPTTTLASKSLAVPADSSSTTTTATSSVPATTTPTTLPVTTTTAPPTPAPSLTWVGYDGPLAGQSGASLPITITFPLQTGGVNLDVLAESAGSVGGDPIPSGLLSFSTTPAPASYTGIEGINHVPGCSSIANAATSFYGSWGSGCEVGFSTAGTYTLSVGFTSSDSRYVSTTVDRTITIIVQPEPSPAISMIDPDVIAPTYGIGAVNVVALSGTSGLPTPTGQVCLHFAYTISPSCATLATGPVTFNNVSYGTSDEAVAVVPVTQHFVQTGYTYDGDGDYAPSTG